MALANYTDLQASIAGWINRTDLTSIIPDFVLLCEADLNRSLRTPENETRNTSFAVSSRFTNVPTDFAEMRRVIIADASRTEVAPLSSIFTGSYPSSGKPLFYSVNGNQLELIPTPDGAYTLEITYYNNVLPLASNSTTPTLTRYPDIYLYGSCYQAGVYLNDGDLVSKFLPLYQKALAAANGKKNKQLGGGLATRVG